MSVIPIGYEPYYDNYGPPTRGYKIVSENEFYKSSSRRSSLKSRARHEEIEDALIDPAYAISPMKPLR